MHPSSLAHSPYYILHVFTTFTTWKKNRLLPSHFRSQRAQCSSSLAFPGMPHSRAALATQARRVPDLCGHPCEATCHAEACATISDHFQPPDPVGLRAAHCFRSQARRTRARPTRLDTDAPAITPALYITPRVPRRPARPLAWLHTPEILRTLDAFPSDQGRFLGYHHHARVSWTPWHSYRMGVCRSR